MYVHPAMARVIVAERQAAAQDRAARLRLADRARSTSPDLGDLGDFGRHPVDLPNRLYQVPARLSRAEGASSACAPP